MKKNIYKVHIIYFLIIIIFSSSKVYADNELSIDANAALIVETNTGKIIYDKDSKEQNYPASVTKILTAILTIEKCKLEDTATVTKGAISNIPSGYVVAPLYVDEKITIKDLLYALMLKSANDAAYVLAEHVGGSVQGFSDMMNKKANELGCKNTHFVNPNGIHDSNHYTTAYDMYLISNYAMKNDIFAKIVSTYQYTLSATNKYTKKDRVMNNTNNFVNPSNKYYNKSVNGVKTGTTTQAGNCLITNSSENGLSFMTVVLGAKTSDDKFSETRKMMEYAYENYVIKKIHKKGEKVKNIEVERATKETKSLNLVMSDDIEAMINKRTNTDKIEAEVTLIESIVAPIQKGQELGTVKYKIEGTEYTSKLLAETDVELKTYYFEIGIGVGVFIAVLLILFVVVKVKKRSKRE